MFIHVEVENICVTIVCIFWTARAQRTQGWYKRWGRE